MTRFILLCLNIPPPLTFFILLLTSNIHSHFSSYLNSPHSFRFFKYTPPHSLIFFKKNPPSFTFYKYILPQFIYLLQYTPPILLPCLNVVPTFDPLPSSNILPTFLYLTFLTLIQPPSPPNTITFPLY